MCCIFRVIIFLIIHESCESCQNYFQYVIGENGATEGLIKFRPQRVSEHNLKIVMTVAAKLPSVNFQ